VFSFGSVLRLYKGGREPCWRMPAVSYCLLACLLESDSCSEGTRLARGDRRPAQKKSAVICFQNDNKKAEIYWTSQPELQRDEVVKGSPA
jgi:hypothetical protein